VQEFTMSLPFTIPHLGTAGLPAGVEGLAESIRSVERRLTERFPIEREVRYRVHHRRGQFLAGNGTSVNISSRGVLFRAEQALPTGKRVELSVSWPISLDNRCALKLLIRGKIVRVEGEEAAVKVEQYEFRTAGVAGR
jgi:c-di-GMP-binding flagellar brake protein YcgR